jgi:hypothetical protein
VSLSTLLLLTGFLFFLAVALTALFLATRNVDDGYEDDAGFHSGRHQTGRARAAQSVRAMLPERLKIMLMPDVPISSLILAPGATPKPPRMNAAPADIELTPATALVPAENALKSPLAAEAAAPKRKRRPPGRKDGPPDGNQLGFPGFAA